MDYVATLTISTPRFSACVTNTERLPIITDIRGAAAEIQKSLGILFPYQIIQKDKEIS